MAPTEPPAVKMSLIERRVRAPLDHRRDPHDAGTHSDAKIRAAHDFLVPRPNLRRPARRLATVKVLAPDELTRHRIHPETLSTGVRPYERTSEPARQPEPSKWCHGSPDGHAWSLQARGLPPLSPDGRRWPNLAFCPLVATFLMLPRSRGAIGRVRATPGAFPTAGRRSDGPDGRVDGIPGKGKGLSQVKSSHLHQGQVKSGQVKSS